MTNYRHLASYNAPERRCFEKVRLPRPLCTSRWLACVFPLLPRPSPLAHAHVYASSLPPPPRDGFSFVYLYPRPLHNSPGRRIRRSTEVRAPDFGPSPTASAIRATTTLAASSAASDRRPWKPPSPPPLRRRQRLWPRHPRRPIVGLEKRHRGGGHRGV